MGLSPNRGGAVGHVVDMAAQISQPVRVSVMSRQVIIMMTSKAKPWIALQMAHEIKLMMFV